MPMPGWWKKSGKNKDEKYSNHSEGASPQGRFLAEEKKLLNKYEFSNRYFDDATISRSKDSSGSRELPTASSRFSGFEPDWGDKKGLPLPRPSVSDVGAGATVSASNSVSSVSSSGSSAEDHATGQPIFQVCAQRGQFELALNTASRGAASGVMSPGHGARSPAPGSRTPSRSTSPLHPRLITAGVETLSVRSEDNRNQCHPLPLPPGSPCSPSQTSARLNGPTESSHITLSTWKKGKLLGRGTFGHVYLGFNSLSGQMCAIKEVRLVSDDQQSKECLKQLNQEINMLSQLSHPNIVRYYGSELGNETLSVYLEFVSGGSIQRLLQEYGPFEEPVIQNYTRQILSGLAYLHGRNTVHRDIKGPNILVDPNGEIKLADFGMAKHITACSSMLSFKGSPYWMAPEVVMNISGYSFPVDIWSLGCTIIEMATSKPPWSQYEGVAAIFKIGNSREIPEIPDSLSSSAKSFIKLCLQRDPSLRPTAMQLLDHSFLRDQVASRSNGITLSGDSSRSPRQRELHMGRPVISVDHATRSAFGNTRLPKSPRDDVRKMASLPVSPSSSPLRQFGHTYFHSPPHPAYGLLHNAGEYPKPKRQLIPALSYPSDLYTEPSILKTRAPNASPRTGLL